MEIEFDTVTRVFWEYRCVYCRKYTTVFILVNSLIRYTKHDDSNNLCILYFVLYNLRCTR